MPENSEPRTAIQKDSGTKHAWPFPFHILQEEWPEVRRARWSFILCAVAFLLIGGAAVYSLFNVFVVPGKDATIQALQAKLTTGSAENANHAGVAFWQGPTNTVYTTNQYCFYQALESCAITNVVNPWSSGTAWTSLTLLNASSNWISLYITCPSARRIGSVTTNALRIGPGKAGVVSILCHGQNFTEYANVPEE